MKYLLNTKRCTTDIKYRVIKSHINARFCFGGLAQRQIVLNTFKKMVKVNLFNITEFALAVLTRAGVIGQFITDQIVKTVTSVSREHMSVNKHGSLPILVDHGGGDEKPRVDFGGLKVLVSYELFK